METSLSARTSTHLFSFKSYYVVWKLKNPLLTAIGLFGFKSYYVVWKQIIKLLFKEGTSIV